MYSSNIEPTQVMATIIILALVVGGVRALGLFFLAKTDGRSPFEVWLQYSSDRHKRELDVERERYRIDRGVGSRFFPSDDQPVPTNQLVRYQNGAVPKE